MPSTSAKQHRFMQAVAHSPSFAKKAGVSQSVGKDFSAADKGKTFNKGGDVMESKKMMGKEVAFMKKKGAPSSMIKHEEKESKSMKFGRGGGMPPPSGARPDPRMMARRPRMGAGMPPSAPPVMPPPPPGGMPPPAQPPMGMNKGGMPMKDGKPAFMQKKMNMGGMAYAKGGVVDDSKDDSAETLTASTLTDAEHRAHKLKFPPKPGETLGGAQTGRVNTKYKGMLMGGESEFPDTGGSRIESRGKPAFGKKMNMGGMAYAKGGGIESRGKTKGTIIRMAAGGSVSSRADGIAQRGKTKFTNY